MKYEVRCECGKAHAVSGADAGSNLACSCGRAVEVPPLHELRAGAGHEVLSPVVRIQALLMEKKLPGTHDCACCHRETDRLARISIECERVVTKSGLSKAEWLGGCFLFGFLFTLLLSKERGEVQRGQDIVLVVPLPVCDVCRPNLGDATQRWQALHRIPEYAALLNRYPRAIVRKLD